MLPWWKIAMSVVPPPMSMSATPRFFSSSVSTAYAEASGWSTMSRTSRPARLQHLMMFCAEVTAPVTMWTSASRRTPDMPSGSRMPSCSSITNCCGSTWSTSRSIGIATALAASMTRSMSPCVTSLSLIAMTPWELKPLMWRPAMPAITASISTPAISSASSTAFLIDSTVESMLTTTPLRIPREGPCRCRRCRGPCR